MKKLISLISLVFLAGLAIVGCSTLTPAPEIVITETFPAGGITDSLIVTFENKNDIDAIITKQVVLFQDTLGASESYSFDISQYIKANSIVKFKTKFAAVPVLGGATSGRTMKNTFSGTDAYGYNKTFTVSTLKICY